MTNLVISEYGYIYHNYPSNLNDKFIHKRVEINQLKEIIKYWQNSKSVRDALEYDGTNLKAKNYVGVVQTQNISIEILPKIFDGKEKNEQKIRDIFISMLKVVLNINEVQINKANLGVTKNKNIYEMFISLFINSIDILIKKGLKSSYILQEQNSSFLKGKLKFNEHIKQNYIHKERFYVEFDEYMQDRAENRLLKSAISLLLKKTKNHENKKALRQQLFIFDNVNISKCIDSDINKINLHRGMEYYDTPLRFAKVFLKHQSFTPLRGKDNVFALLFPMEKLFEEYMAVVLNNSKKELGIDKVLINGNKNEYFISDKQCNMARLQPDYLLQMKDSKEIIIDAKYKLFETKEDETKGCNTINISSGDVYQIFAYLNFYDCKNTAYLFVPKIGRLSENEFVYQTSKINLDFKLMVIPIDLENIIKTHKLENIQIGGI